MEFIRDIDELETLMQTAEVRFCFVKKNGELRDAVGTRCLHFIPAEDWPKGTSRRTTPETVLPFYDCRKNVWRCLLRTRFVAVISEV